MRKNITEWVDMNGVRPKVQRHAPEMVTFDSHAAVVFMPGERVRRREIAGMQRLDCAGLRDGVRMWVRGGA